MKFRWIVLVGSFCWLSAAHGAGLVVMSSIGARSAIDELAREFERQGHPLVVLKYDTAAALKQEIDRGAAFDLAVLTEPIAAGLTKAGRLVAAEHRVFAYARIGLAGKAGAPQPDISSREAFARALLAADKIAYARDGASGVYFRRLIDDLGLAERLNGKLLPMTGSREIHAVAEGEATYGVQLISEILPVAGVELIAPFPDSLQNVTELDVDISATSAHPIEARALAAFLTSTAGNAAVTHAGMDSP